MFDTYNDLDKMARKKTLVCPYPRPKDGTFFLISVFLLWPAIVRSSPYQYNAVNRLQDHNYLDSNVLDHFRYRTMTRFWPSLAAFLSHINSPQGRVSRRHGPVLSKPLPPGFNKSAQRHGGNKGKNGSKLDRRGGFMPTIRLGIRYVKSTFHSLLLWKGNTYHSKIKRRYSIIWEIVLAIFCNTL